MSDKMLCPGCGGESSSVLIRVARGEPCPFCGLSAAAVLEVAAVRRKKADEDLKERLAAALIDLDRSRAEVAVLRRAVEDALDALGPARNVPGG